MEPYWLHSSLHIIVQKSNQILVNDIVYLVYWYMPTHIIEIFLRL